MTFRTNSCYDHWWEGRKMFGSMGIHCLDVARVARGWLAKRDPQLAARILRLLIAYSAVFKSQLRDEVKVRSGHHGWLAATCSPNEGLSEAWRLGEGAGACLTACLVLLSNPLKS
jgi:hypothetical protein